MATDTEIERDLRTLARFIGFYCGHKHAGAAKTAAALKGFDVELIAGGPLNLCPDCAKLLAHAFTKRSRCPMNPKPACKHCPNHCYHPAYREKIREVMKYSGTRMVLSGRLDYLYHLLF